MKEEPHLSRLKVDRCAVSKIGNILVIKFHGFHVMLDRRLTVLLLSCVPCLLCSCFHLLPLLLGVLEPDLEALIIGLKREALRVGSDSDGGGAVPSRE